MTVINSPLFIIIRRFPSSREKLHHLYVNTHSFRILCKDYLLCTEALIYWKRFGGKQPQERYLEYKELKASLEREIEDFLGCGQSFTIDESSPS